MIQTQALAHFLDLDLVSTDLRTIIMDGRQVQKPLTGQTIKVLTLAALLQQTMAGKETIRMTLGVLIVLDGVQAMVAEQEIEIMEDTVGTLIEEEMRETMEGLDKEMITMGVKIMSSDHLQMAVAEGMRVDQEEDLLEEEQMKCSSGGSIK